ncbi:MAG: AAA family ATPase [Acidimicrobiaceae bacterium]|nr:AAA family ATPase [Acidimicrobiaceae bacterium]
MSIEGLVRERRVIICAGSGGVGKTTVAAAIGLVAARAGRRACVVTIDPARRLADALGLAELANDPRPVEGIGPGELWALMLDTKSTFDALVRRYAATPDQAETILANGLYRNISGALGGTQEYMAVEKLWELADDPRFDLVVVDTPPTRNALDFLEAPERLNRFLTNRVFRALMMPTRVGLRAVNVATQLFVRTVSRVIGGEVVGDVLALFTAFDGMEEGFRRRAGEMTEMLHDRGTAFVVIAAPRRDAVAEARFFASHLTAGSLPLEAMVVNLVTPQWGPAPAGSFSGALAELVTNLAELSRTAEGEAKQIERLVAGLGDVALVRVPTFDADVHDLSGLGEVGRFLVAPAPSSGPR